MFTGESEGLVDWRGVAGPLPWVLAAALLIAILTGCERDRDSVTEETGPTATELEADVMDWRQRRLDRLTEPYGWLSLAGLDFVSDGTWQVGSDDDMDIVTPAGPAFWGELVVEDGEARFLPDSEAVSVDGHAGQPGHLTQPDRDEPVWVEADDVRLQVFGRNDRLAVRSRWPQARALRDFMGLDYFDFDRDWVIEARFEAHPAGTTMPVGSVLGDITEEPNPGAVIFEVDGREFRLEAVASADGKELFFIFADRTTGRETYGAGRFLYADLPDERDRTVLDFNRAYNPPCAFTEYSTCPLPPPENRLDIRVEAGELRYAGDPGFTEF
jgi:uncharacterized protein